MEAKHAPLYTPKISIVMIVIYLWCHWYVIQYRNHVFHNMHVLDIRPSTLCQKNSTLKLKMVEMRVMVTQGSRRGLMSKMRLSLAWKLRAEDSINIVTIY